MFKNLLNRIRAVPGAPGAPAAPAASPAAIAAAAFGARAASTPAPLAAAVASTEQVARADALVAEGNALEDAGDLAQAELRYRAAVEAAPGHARSHLNLGIVLAARDDADGAVAAYEQVLAIDPRHPFGHYNYARLVFVRGDLARAERMLREALRSKPEFPHALILLASVLESAGDAEAAAGALEQAVALEPANAGAWFNLALLRLELKRLEDCETAVRALLALAPDNPGGLALLSALMRHHEFPSQARELMEAAIRHDPRNLGYQSEHLLLLNFEDGLGAADLFARHVAFGERLEALVPQRFTQFAGSRDPARRLRVGYLSGDFISHPVTIFLLPVLEHRDRAAIEVFCYSTARKSDQVTQRVRDLCDHWLDAAAMSDVQLADAIHADAVDILVDLGGHTHDARVGVFSQRPAPVQATWLGYLNTTGLTRMDYRLTDRRSDPPELSQPFHTERLVALPDSQWCYVPVLDAPPAPGAPCETNGYITFGSFNAGLKITPATCHRWAQLLMRVPGSRLRIADIGSERRRASLLREMATAGLAPDRVEFIPRVGIGAYLRLFDTVDIALDTYPYGGGTTTFDALWMGVPVVTAFGDLPASRSATSILQALDLPEWSAHHIADFVDVAVARASDREAIASLRRTLRERMKASPLTDPISYTRHLEAAYRSMWAAHCH